MGVDHFGIGVEVEKAPGAGGDDLEGQRSRAHREKE